MYMNNDLKDFYVDTNSVEFWFDENRNGGCMLSTNPANNPKHRQHFQMEIPIRKKSNEKMTVKSGAVNIMVNASPRGRNARHLQYRCSDIHCGIACLMHFLPEAKVKGYATQHHLSGYKQASGKVRWQ